MRGNISEVPSAIGGGAVEPSIAIAAIGSRQQRRKLPPIGQKNRRFARTFTDDFTAASQMANGREDSVNPARLTRRRGRHPVTVDT